MNETTKRAPCPRCGEETNIISLENDPGEAGDPPNWCQTCGYVYEDCWQSYPWLKTKAA